MKRTTNWCNTQHNKQQKRTSGAIVLYVTSVTSALENVGITGTLAIAVLWAIVLHHGNGKGTSSICTIAIDTDKVSCSVNCWIAVDIKRNGALLKLVTNKQNNSTILNNSFKYSMLRLRNITKR